MLRRVDRSQPPARLPVHGGERAPEIHHGAVIARRDRPDAGVRRGAPVREAAARQVDDTQADLGPFPGEREPATDVDATACRHRLECANDSSQRWCEGRATLSGEAELRQTLASDAAPTDARAPPTRIGSRRSDPTKPTSPITLGSQGVATPRPQVDRGEVERSASPTEENSPPITSCFAARLEHHRVDSPADVRVPGRRRTTPASTPASPRRDLPPTEANSPAM